MSVESMAIALHHSTATGSAKVVLLGIANHDGDGGAYPSIETLAKYARFKGWDATPLDDTREAKAIADKQLKNAKQSARDAVRKLEALGEVEVIVNGGGSIHKPIHERPNLYIIRIKCPADCDRTSQHRTSPVEKSDPHPPGHSQAPRSEPGTPPGHSQAEPSLNHNLGNPVSRSEKSRGNDRVSESPEMQDEYADLTPGEKQARARKRMTSARDRVTGSGSRYTAPAAPRIPRFDPSLVPPEPPPRSPEDDAAVAALLATPCPTGRHMIPRTSTICLRCGIDARNITLEATQ